MLCPKCGYSWKALAALCFVAGFNVALFLITSPQTSHAYRFAHWWAADSWKALFVVWSPLIAYGLVRFIEDWLFERRRKAAAAAEEE